MTDARTAAPERLPDALQGLRDQVAAVDLGLATPERDAAARNARAVVDQVDDYLLPRLRDLGVESLDQRQDHAGSGRWGEPVRGLAGVRRGDDKEQCKQAGKCLGHTGLDERVGGDDTKPARVGDGYPTSFLLSRSGRALSLGT